jgi:hypothetical protein
VDQPWEAAFPPRRGPGSVLSGWPKAVVGALVAVVAAGAAAEVIAVLAYVAETPRPQLLALARFGGLLFFAFNRVTVVFAASGGDFAGIAGGVRVTAALLGGMALIVWLLAWAGRQVAELAGGSALARGLHGAKVALPYALICFGLAFLVTVPEGSLADGFPQVHPSHLEAFLWPLTWGAVAGFVGGLRSAPRRATEATPSRVARDAVEGGLAMLGLGLVLAFASLVALAPFQPGPTRAYFRPFEGSAADGLALVYVTVLGLPNLASMLVLFPTMNVCPTVAGNPLGADRSVCLLDPTHWPRGSDIDLFGGGINLHGPPPAFYLFVLVPLVAVLAGGAVAARRAHAGTVRESVRAGALAGVAFGLASAALAFLATAGVAAGPGADGVSGAFHITLGPPLAMALAMGLAWGVGGGALGGLIRGRHLPRVPGFGPPDQPAEGERGATPGPAA